MKELKRVVDDVIEHATEENRQTACLVSNCIGVLLLFDQMTRFIANACIHASTAIIVYENVDCSMLLEIIGIHNTVIFGLIAYRQV